MKVPHNETSIREMCSDLEALTKRAKKVADQLADKSCPVKQLNVNHESQRARAMIFLAKWVSDAEDKLRYAKSPIS